jgi:predicted amidohydrolase YtcJ
MSLSVVALLPHVSGAAMPLRFGGVKVFNASCLGRRTLCTEGCAPKPIFLRQWDIGFMDEQADRILLGRVRPLDGDDQVVEAIAIAGDRVLATGSRQIILARRAAYTEVLDYGRATIISGFNDAHAHMDREGLKSLRPSLRGASSIADILAKIATLAAITPAGHWIVTMPVGDPPHYFDGLASLAERRMPTRQELDRAAPDHPVCIPGLFGNWGVPPGYTALNSRALALNGIDRSTTPRCTGVEICHDEAGEPTGVIIERNPRPTVEFDLLPNVPAFGFADRIGALRASIGLYHARGTTSVYEGHGSAAEIIAAYRQLWDNGELTMRTGLVVSPSWSGIAEATVAMRDWLAFARGRGLGDPMLRISGVHVAYGGDSIVAALARASLPNTGWSGFVEQAVGPSEFEEMCRLAATFDLRLHTIVANKLHEVVPVLERVAEGWPIGERRWVVEHIGPCQHDDLIRLKRLGVWVTLIPAYMVWKGGSWFDQLPAHEAALVAPARQLIDLGVPVSAGTDNIPYDPLFTLWVMVARRARGSGAILGPAGRLSPFEALRLLTTAGAWLTFDESVKGPLAPGYFADLTVLSDDPLTIGDAAMPPKIDCRMTMVGGQVVYAR